MENRRFLQSSTDKKNERTSRRHTHAIKHSAQISFLVCLVSGRGKQKEAQFIFNPTAVHRENTDMNLQNVSKGSDSHPGFFSFLDISLLSGTKSRVVGATDDLVCFRSDESMYTVTKHDSCTTVDRRSRHNARRLEKQRPSPSSGHFQHTKWAWHPVSSLTHS